MEKMTCAGCGKSYWPNQGWQHEKCVNRPDQPVQIRQEVVKPTVKWQTREEFQAYRRVYMRAYRARQKVS